MTRYIVKRFLLMFPTLLGVAVLVFVLLRIVPGDVVEMRFASGQNQFLDQKMLDAERATIFLVDRERQELWSKVAMGDDIGEIRVPLGQGIAGTVAVTID